MAKGWGLEYFDYVVDTETVNHFLEDLWRFEVHRDDVLKYLKHVADFESDLTKCGWFLELSRSRFDVYHPPKSILVDDILADDNRLRQALDLVLESGKEGTYWDDTLRILGI